MSGIDTNGAYIARVGSFVADGNGSITAGLEDLVQGSSGASEITFSGGSYTIQSNGRGLLVFSNTNGGGLQLNIALLSTSQGIMVQTDLNASTNGGFALQTPSEFSVNALKGNYVFDFSGISFSAQMPHRFRSLAKLLLTATGTSRAECSIQTTAPFPVHRLSRSEPIRSIAPGTAQTSDVAP